MLKQYSKLQATHGQQCPRNVDIDVHFDFGGMGGGWFKGEFVLFQQHLYPMKRFCITPPPPNPMYVDIRKLYRPFVIANILHNIVQHVHDHAQNGAFKRKYQFSVTSVRRA